MTSNKILLALAAFDKNQHGQIVLAFPMRLIDNEPIAVDAARWMAIRYDGVVVWQYQIRPAIILFSAGTIPSWKEIFQLERDAPGQDSCGLDTGSAHFDMHAIARLT